MNDKPISTLTNESLLPCRHQNYDLFLCDVADAVLKSDMASMEHPFFSLSKKPETAVRRYENGDKWVEVVPSVKGLATIYDKDILIYCISQLISKMNDGNKPSPYVKIIAKDLLIFINRSIGGKDYEALGDALQRLDGTRIRTNVKTGDEETLEGFGLIENFKIRRSEKTGRILEISVKLSDWVFRSIESKEVLTLHRDYFRLRKPIEKRVYEIARKHCGSQDSWKISVERLKLKCGSKSPLKSFRHDIKQLATGKHLPDYEVEIDASDNVVFTNRSAAKPSIANHSLGSQLKLDEETFHDARIVAPGYDVYYLLREWQNWWAESGCPTLHSPDKAFISFCKARYERNPNP
ncbi:MAG: replication initiator protein A [Alphaproteobacteria bacterium]|nr:replication initiator protein A [Alphaproteobacteria bacterium]OJV44981.1 MAG: plasmid replication initiator [Alphaproteobacteria bacterium 43-37]